jgi:2-polyprenyl-6-methoxyphenol hydroxylase-like FAD-dependent oxidoreductase
MHAEIAGAGFAGLTAAIALHCLGWTVRVHEKGTFSSCFSSVLVFDFRQISPGCYRSAEA